MKSVGIICEYNPFHNGHLFHLSKVKEMFKDHVIILIMSSSFLERGETSIIDKWQKTNIALHYGIDLVIELPFPFASQSADIFARGSISLLNHLKADYLVFGSETNDIDSLVSLANVQLNHASYNDLVQDYLQQGYNYPTSLSKALEKITTLQINKPNDLLGISYIKEIMTSHSSIKPICIKRTNDYHGTSLDGEIVSATSIRNAIKNDIDIKNFVPEETYKLLKKKLHFIEDYFPFLKYQIIINLNRLDDFQTVDEGIENRIKKYIFSAKNLDDLINKVKTKRYTYNRIRRMFVHILCNFTKEEAKYMKEIEYIRVLGFNKQGQKYLKSIKKDLTIPLITNLSKLNNKMLDFEFRVTSVYASILDEEDKINLIEAEYKNKPIIM
ncbi:MAG: nucleotidyltransferase [Bacilli bacterium]|nr:nucleotidyltransferase [Bacilli bacterium]